MVPLKQIVVFTLAKSNLTVSMKLNAIPSSIITSNINAQKHLSYALEKSNLRKTKNYFDFFA
jgi:TfoX/Sxy family transcriptional regulator of competence genes